MEKMTTALQLLLHLGAYCPRVKIMNEEIMAKAKADVKRHKRARIGRGYYGKHLTAHFQRTRMAAKNG